MRKQLNQMTMPNFLIIGAMKSGTTTLHNYLNQHPQIYMSPLKEPHFFSCEALKNSPINNLEDYCALFQGVSEVAIGESSTSYLALPEISAKKIKHYIPNAKLIAILREPAEAAYSLYLMIHRSELHGISEEQILARFVQTQIIQNNRNSGIIKGRYYYGKLQHYLSLFDRRQIKICLYEDLKANPVELLQDIFQFLGVDEKFTIDKSNQYNTGGIPKNKLFYDLTENLKKNLTLRQLIPKSFYQPIFQTYLVLRKRNLAKQPQLSQNIRKQLTELYREDILKLQDLISRDLSKWLE